MRRVLLLGSTGSIGTQALQVIAASRDLTVVGLSCEQNVSLLLEQATSLGVADIAVADDSAAATVSASLYPELSIRSGPGAAACMVREVDADLVLNAIVGFAGLESTLAALEAGRHLALANKESLVCAGSLVMALAARQGVTILPVDSEHSALFQLMAAAGRDSVRAAVITASGGPFRGRVSADLAGVTRAQALAHPTWTMGEKITIDSATLMNKGLEIIEAHHLFGLSYDDIEVVVHPQSVVHAMVRLADGAVLAHLGVADMRVPIAFALRYPARSALPIPSLDLATVGSLGFEAPDDLTFPAMELARCAGRRGDRATCCLNAANEVAVHSFLSGGVSFLGIAEAVGKVLADSPAGDFAGYEEVVDVDTWARSSAKEVCREMSGDV